MAKKSGQKFIARNRAPRVQIEYDVEVYGSEKTVQLPFVMGVMADLSGKPEEALPAVSDRKYLEIDVDNFDDRMKAMKPRVAFPVANTLTGEGNLSVDITFESMDDFSPAAVARKVEPLRKLLETRTQLSNLMTWMDGKSGAEDLIADLLQDQALLQTLTSTARPADAEAAPAADDASSGGEGEASSEGDESPGESS
jgi:type VI secretion system protein ImpB